MLRLGTSRATKWRLDPVELGGNQPVFLLSGYIDWWSGVLYLLFCSEGLEGFILEGSIAVGML